MSGVPTIITNLTAIIAFFLSLIGFGVAVAKITWLRRLYNYLVVEPLSRWFRREVTEAARPLQEQIDNHFQYVKTHLGPNGDTTPIHERLIALEHRLGITDRRGE